MMMGVWAPRAAGALPPTSVRAHWDRVRIAEREASSQVVGNLRGAQGTTGTTNSIGIRRRRSNARHGLNPTVRDL